MRETLLLMAGRVEMKYDPGALQDFIKTTCVAFKTSRFVKGEEPLYHRGFRHLIGGGGGAKLVGKNLEEQD